MGHPVYMYVYGPLMWLICPATSINCFPHYLKFLTLFVVFIGGGLFLRLLGLCYVIAYFLCVYMELLRLPVLYGLYLFFTTYGVSFSPLDVGYKAGRVFDSG